MAGTLKVSDANRIVMQHWNRPANSLPNEIPDKDRMAFYDDVAEYIATHSSEFTPEANEYARRRLSSDLYLKPLADTSFNWGMFGSEMGNNAVKIAKAGGSTIQNAVYLGVVVLIIVYFFPRIVASFKK